jgi:hypothetical protein
MAADEDERSHLLGDLDVLGRLLRQAEHRKDTLRANAIRDVMRDRRCELARLDEHEPSSGEGASD